MSFLKPSGAGFNAADSGLGSLIGADPSRISSIANSIGTGMNGIAMAGGATPGYYGAPPPQQNNYLQTIAQQPMPVNINSTPLRPTQTLQSGIGFLPEYAR